MPDAPLGLLGLASPALRLRSQWNEGTEMAGRRRIHILGTVRGRRQAVRDLVGLTVLAMLATLLAWVTTAPPAVAEEPSGGVADTLLSWMRRRVAAL